LNIWEDLGIDNLVHYVAIWYLYAILVY
jgi:hypothetical protein